MPGPTQFQNDVVFNAAVSFAQAPTFPGASITDDDISGSADITYSKLQAHATQCVELAGFATEPVSGTYVPLHLSSAVGGIVGFQAQMTGVLPATTGVVSIELYRCTSGSTPVSILSAPVRLGSDNSLMVPEAGTISTSTMIAGDSYYARMTVSTTTVARGVICALKYYEKPA